MGPSLFIESHWPSTVGVQSEVQMVNTVGVMTDVTNVLLVKMITYASMAT